MNDTLARTRRLHDAASRNQHNSYTDPASGLFVMTAYYLSERGYCCGVGCRHCPWDQATQVAAGRPEDAPCWQRN
jgi:hypothetical protein